MNTGQVNGSEAVARFPDEIVAAVTAHMNDDHADDCLLIVQGLAGATSARRAWMSDLDASHAQFSWSAEQGSAVGADDAVTIARIPWGIPVRERADIRVAVVDLYTRAAIALGQTPRESGEH